MRNKQEGTSEDFIDDLSEEEEERSETSEEDEEDDDEESSESEEDDEEALTIWFVNKWTLIEIYSYTLKYWTFEISADVIRTPIKIYIHIFESSFLLSLTSWTIEFMFSKML